MPSPIPRQEFGDPLGWMVRQAREHVGEPSPWIDVVELGGLDERVDGGRAMAEHDGSSEGRGSDPYTRFFAISAER